MNDVRPVGSHQLNELKQWEVKTWIFCTGMEQLVGTDRHTQYRRITVSYGNQAVFKRFLIEAFHYFDDSELCASPIQAIQDMQNANRASGA
jgi:hypothetical protein